MSLGTFTLRLQWSFSYLAEAFNGCYDKLSAIKWFDFCFSRTLRVIFKWLISGGTWITTGGGNIYIYIYIYIYIDR